MHLEGSQKDQEKSKEKNRTACDLNKNEGETCLVHDTHPISFECHQGSPANLSWKAGICWLILCGISKGLRIKESNLIAMASNLQTKSGARPP